MIEVSRRLRPAAALLVAVLVGSCGDTVSPDQPPGGTRLPRGLLVIQTGGDEVRVQVEIAETPSAKTRGLMGRRSLPESAGMVFLESEPVRTGFWMKDTLLPLSVAFWDRHRRIFEILDMEPCERDPCPVYEPGGAWVGAVEVNQGFFEAHGVDPGDRIRLES